MYVVVKGYKFKNIVIPESKHINITLSDDSRISGELKDVTIASGVSIVDGVNYMTVSLDSIQSIDNGDTITYPSYYIGQVSQLCINGIFISIGDKISIKYKSLFGGYIRNTKVIGFTDNKVAVENKVIDLNKIVKIKKR